MFHSVEFVNVMNNYSITIGEMDMYKAKIENYGNSKKNKITTFNRENALLEIKLLESIK